MKQLIYDDGFNVKQIFLSDEANFYLHTHVRKQNYRFWAHESPHITEIEELKLQKVTDSCASQIFGSVVIEENITGDVYQNLLKFDFLPLYKKIIF